MKYKSLLILILVCFSCSLITSCDDFGNPFKPETMLDKPLTQKKEKEEEIDENEGEPDTQQSAQLEDYQRPTYPNGIRRNPFQPDPAFLLKQAEFQSDVDRVKDPLEAFGIGQLKLVAIISGITVPKAMFIDPDGLGHFTKIGDRIGMEGFVVTAIREDSVSLATSSDDNDPSDSPNKRVHSEQIIRLNDMVPEEDRGLSDEDKAALERILTTEAGQKAVQDNLQQNTLSATLPNPVNANPGGY